MIIPNLDINIPGLPAAMQARLSTLINRLVEDPKRRGRLTALYEDRGSLFCRLHNAQSINEPQYLSRLTETSEESKRREIMQQQISKRCNFVAAVLAWNGFELERLDAARALALALNELRTLVSGLPADHALVAFVQLVAGVVRHGGQPLQTAESMLEEAKDLPVESALSAVQIVFADIKAGSGYFFTNPLELPIVKSNGGFCTTNHELVEALRDAEEMHHAFAEPLLMFHRTKERLNRPQFASRLEGALQGTEVRITFEQLVVAQEDSEADFYTAVENLKLWYGKLTQVRLRLKAAIASASAEVKVGSEIWSMRRAFGKGNELNAYAVMVNCIGAQYWLARLDRFDRDYQKVHPEFKDFRTDPFAYIDKVLAEVQ